MKDIKKIFRQGLDLSKQTRAKAQVVESGISTVGYLTVHMEMVD